jgi:hypothetical protein
MRFEIRPLGAWTDPATDPRRSSGAFRATWDDTVALLGFEAGKLGAEHVIISVDVLAGQIRRDGMLYSKAQVNHPGVVVSLQSRFGPLRYATDAYEQQWSATMPGWQANVRAIALALEALRAVDRHGVSKRGEQYAGWTALPAGTSGTLRIFDSADEALRWMRKAAGGGSGDGLSPAALYKLLARVMHPDTGGNTELWERLDAARQLLSAAGML